MNWSHTLDEQMVHQRRTNRKNVAKAVWQPCRTLQLAGYWHRKEKQDDTTICEIAQGHLA